MTIDSFNFGVSLRVKVFQNGFSQVIIKNKNKFYLTNVSKKFYDFDSLSFYKDTLNSSNPILCSRKENYYFFHDNKNNTFYLTENFKIIDSLKLKKHSSYVGKHKKLDVFTSDSSIIFKEPKNKIVSRPLLKRLLSYSSTVHPPFLIEQAQKNIYYSSINSIRFIQKINSEFDLLHIFLFNNRIYVLNKNLNLKDIKNKTTINLIKNSTVNYILSSTYKPFISKDKLFISNSLNIFEISSKLIIKYINKCQFYLYDSSINKYKFYDKFNFKSAYEYHNIIFISQAHGIYKNSNIEKNIFKTISNEKCKTLFIDSKNRFWLSKGDGIFYTKEFDPVIKNLKKLDVGNNISLEAYEFKEDAQGNVIIATNNGIYFLTTNNSIYRLSTEQGLTSNECKKIDIDRDGSLWIATNKGVNHFSYTFNLKNQFHRINYFLKEDGIQSDNIRDFLITGDSIYIVSDKGLDLVSDKNWKVDTTEIKIHINKCFINGEKLDTTAFPILNHTQNSLQIDFSSIYYERTDRMKVFYRLISNGDTFSQEVKDRSILLQSLSPNEYILEIYAYDQDYPYNKSAIRRVYFTISPPFYKTWWFISVIILVVLSIIAAIYYLNLKRIREQHQFETQKLNLEKDLSKFKLEALKAEMNPHFIFNCLNSIKDFIIRNESEKSQYYLSQLSKLIRIALYNTKEEFISIRSELEFIDLYVELEQLRFSHQFDFIKIIKNQELLNAEVPTMILQPFFENAIRHGKIGQLGHRGKLVLEILEEGRYIVFQIRDNGIGIHQSTLIKKESNSSHKSMALDIIRERIQIYNQSYDLDIEMRIFEIHDGEFKTGVEIKYILD